MNIITSQQNKSWSFAHTAKQQQKPLHTPIQVQEVSYATSARLRIEDSFAGR